MRYLLGFFITIGLLIVLIVVLFSSNNSTTTQKTVPNQVKNLQSYSTTNAEVRLTVDGPINADQSHDQYQITVNQNNTTYNLFQGYNQTVTKSQTYANNQASYDSFLHALSHNGYTIGNTDKSLADEKGYCALGSRYVFEIIQNGKDLERFWATSCGGTHTYEGDLDDTLALFRAQVPDYDSLTDNIDLNY